MLFRSSARPGTPAAAARKQLPEDVKAARLEALQSLLNEQAASFARRCVGLEFEVLFEKKGRHEGQLIGRSPYLQSVHVAAGPHAIGDMARVTITKAMPHSLSGELVSCPAAVAL